MADNDVVELSIKLMPHIFKVSLFACCGVWTNFVNIKLIIAELF